MATNVLNTLFNGILDDRRFLIMNSNSPEIQDGENSEIFFKKYIEYCKEIEFNRRDKIKEMMHNLGFSTKNCQAEIVKNLNQMLTDCGNELSNEEKDFLDWNKSSDSYDDYSSVPKVETVKKWLSETGYREPRRLYLYKIAFALGLKAYFPKEITDDTSPEYKKSVNYLFNKIYNQRYVTRAADELIFIYCLKNEKNYTTAMKMLAKYRKKCQEINFTHEVKFHTKSNNTLFFIQNNIANNEDNFLNDLVVLTPLLDDRYSSIFSQLEEFIEYFSDNDKMNEFDAKCKNSYIDYTILTSYNEDNYVDFSYTSYMNLGEKILMSDVLKKNLLLLDKRMSISSAFFDNDIKSDNIKELFLKLGISENLYNHLKKYASNSISAKFGKGTQKYFSDIISDIIITKNDIYNSDIITRKEKADGTYTWQPKPYDDLMSHNMIYKNLRTALITAHFFYYWSDSNSQLSYKGYKDEINEVLTNNFYLGMDIKNSFDCFFMLCAKTLNPIDSYYNIFNTIFYIYDDYNNEFINSKDIKNEFYNYDRLSAKESILSIEERIEKTLHVIDKKNIQKEILKMLQI